MTTTPARRIHRLTLLAWLLCMQPLFTLIIRGWSSATLVLGGLACLVALIVSRKVLFRAVPGSLSKGWEFHSFLLSNSLLFVCVALLGLVRNDVHPAMLDSPARFLFAIPVFILLRQLRVNITQTLLLCVTLGLLFTLADQTFFPSKNPWSKDRMSSHFADPLAFGYIALSFSMMALTSLVYPERPSRWRALLTVLAICAGIYMSIMTASRTGWLAIPLVVMFLLYLKRKQLNLRTTAISLCLVVAAPIVAFGVSENVRSRVNAAVNDVAGYSFEGIAPDTSVGMRITFLRIASDMIAEQPLTGYGDTQAKKPEVPAIVKTYASPFTIDFALSSGFHNEVVTNAVQYGVPSGVAALLLFLVPLAIYWKNLNNPLPSNRLAAALGIAFCLTYFISSLSTEVFGLKYTASLYGLMTAILCAAATRPEPQTP